MGGDDGALDEPVERAADPGDAADPAGAVGLGGFDEEAMIDALTDLLAIFVLGCYVAGTVRLAGIVVTARRGCRAPRRPLRGAVRRWCQVGAADWCERVLCVVFVGYLGVALAPMLGELAGAGHGFLRWAVYAFVVPL